MVTALSASIFLARFGHGALSAHFLILLTLVAYFRLVERPARWWEWALLVALPAASLLVVSYLAVMVAALGVATVLEATRRRLATPLACLGVCLAIPIAAVLTLRLASMIGPDALRAGKAALRSLLDEPARTLLRYRHELYPASLRADHGGRDRRSV